MKSINEAMNKLQNLKVESKEITEGQVDVHEDGYIYYNGELRGYQYKDGSSIQISNFTGYGNKASFILYTTGKSEQSLELYGTVRDAVRLIKEIIDKNYETAEEAINSINDFNKDEYEGENVNESKIEESNDKDIEDLDERIYKLKRIIKTLDPGSFAKAEYEQELKELEDKVAKLAPNRRKQEKKLIENEEDKVYVITDGNRPEIKIKQSDISDWSGDLQIASNGNFSVMMYWNEEMGYEYIDHIYAMYEGGSPISLGNLTKDTPFLVTLSPEDFDTLKDWFNKTNEENESSDIKENKNLTEDSYEEGIFYEIEQALEEAGMNPTRFVDDGIMTNNIGWTVTGENGERQQITCDGSWLSEKCLKEDNEKFTPQEEKFMDDNENLVWAEYANAANVDLKEIDNSDVDQKVLKQCVQNLMKKNESSDNSEKLENPYYIKQRNDGRWQISSSHPYDNTDYSFAISDTENKEGTYTVYEPQGNKRNLAVSHDTDYEEVLDIMKEIDSKRESNISMND